MGVYQCHETPTVDEFITLLCQVPVLIIARYCQVLRSIVNFYKYCQVLTILVLIIARYCQFLQVLPSINNTCANYCQVLSSIA